MYLVHLISIDLELSRSFNTHTCTVTKGIGVLEESRLGNIKKGLLKDEIIPKGDLRGATTMLLRVVFFSGNSTRLLPSLNRPY